MAHRPERANISDVTGPDTDREFLLRAVQLAERGPAADPNPRVGAVVVADGRVVGEGFHQGAGTSHAEVVALKHAGSRARGGTAYVSLEPCNHQGRTPPCVDALLAAGVARVIYAMADPHDAASGGAAALRNKRIEVEHRPLPQAEALNRRWAYALTHQRPFVTWKVAATLDGRVAADDGSSRWITADQARAQVHQLRGECGAIVVGTGTLLTDDPALTVRDAEGREHDRQPLRVVVGHRPVPDEAAVRASADWIQVRSHDPATVLTELHQRQIRHALLEGGPSLAAAWLRAGAVTEIVAYVAPTLLGAGPSLIGELGVRTLGEALHLELHEVARVGDDVRLVLTPRVVSGADADEISAISPIRMKE